MLNRLSEYISIQLIIKILVFVMAMTTVLQLPFINGSLIFWGVLSVVGIYNFYLMIIDFKGYFNKYKYEFIFLITCIFSSIINIKYNNLYSFVYILITANLIFSMLPYVPSLKKNYIENEIKIIGYLIVIFTFIMGCISLYNSVSVNQNEFFELIKGARYTGLYLNPNQLAYWCFASIVFSYKLIKNKVVYLNIVLQIFLLLISGCRSAYLALAFLIMFNGYIKTKNKKLIIYMGIGVGIFIVSYTLFRYQWLYKYMGKGLDKQFFHVISGGRYYVWEEAFNVFLQRPIFGVGVNNLRYAAIEFLDKNSTFISGNWEDTHNIVLTLLSYCGLIGLVAFIFMIFKHIKNTFKIKEYFDVSVVFGCLIIGLLDIGILFDDRIISVLFWYFIGVCFFKYNKISEK